MCPFRHIKLSFFLGHLLVAGSNVRNRNEHAATTRAFRGPDPIPAGLNNFTPSSKLHSQPAGAVSVIVSGFRLCTASTVGGTLIQALLFLSRHPRSFGYRIEDIWKIAANGP
ncbi:hypothetical protein C8Q75DRAFT_732746 [Abortiporus biennis]|nr:hypothetical protein C8Q75DRAFT_732746 [Abortiporus biennis]